MYSPLHGNPMNDKVCEDAIVECIENHAKEKVLSKLSAEEADRELYEREKERRHGFRK